MARGLRWIQKVGNAQPDKVAKGKKKITSNESNRMIKLKTFATVSALGLSFLGSSILADDGAKPTTPPGLAKTPPGVGRVLHQPDQANGPDRPALPKDVQKLVDQFKKEQEAFLQKQEELRKQFKDATGDKRDTIRDQLKDAREKWNEESKKLRDQIKDRLQELKVTLRNNRDKQLDAAAEAKNQNRGKQ